MKLFNRDYNKLTPGEHSKWQALCRKERGNNSSLPTHVSEFINYPKAARHAVHLFPNNYLDIGELKQKRRLTKQLKDFRRLLDSPEVSEHKILNFINQNRVYFIIGAILKSYFRFGHHQAFLFREFPFGTSHKADYLLVGLGSGGWGFVFVELECPRGPITNADGRIATKFRKGLNQVEDWEIWLQANFSSLREEFDKHRNSDDSRCEPGLNFPDEFLKLDPTRIHFVVVAGRRRHFKEKTYLERRKRETQRQLLLHYDNLLEAAETIISAKPINRTIFAREIHESYIPGNFQNWKDHDAFEAAGGGKKRLTTLRTSDSPPPKPR